MAQISHMNSMQNLMESCAM